MTDLPIAADTLASMRTRFRDYKTMGDRTLAQCTDAIVTREITPGSNSIAIIVKHVGGNLRSRWTDFLTSDGEKPDRHRDAEFEDGAVSLATVTAWWNDGWAPCLATLDALTPEDLGRSITIRGQPLTVPDAMLRSLAHTAYHVGQMVMLAKAYLGDAWTTLSIARGQSEQFTRGLRGTR